jgi:hypothetical protein
VSETPDGRGGLSPVLNVARSAIRKQTPENNARTYFAPYTVLAGKEKKQVSLKKNLQVEVVLRK